ncbi:MAG: hypothetical protein JNL50_12815 [Phycisphaerae bacterium]|nr:hypothetical protein [Phycisphaerae bacterium]
MARVARLILAFLLVLRSLPGIAAGPCTPISGGMMSPPVPLAIANGEAESCGATCPCCVDSVPAEPASGGDEGIRACRCELSQSQPTPSPQTPPTNPSGERVPLSALPLSVANLGVPGPSAAAPRVNRLMGAPKRSGNSIQSVLCVWTE